MMKNEEKQLFRSLCCFRADSFDENLLEYATPEVLGHLFFNRMQAIAYGTLQKHNLLGKVNREFRNSLRAAYEQNKEKNNSFFSCIQTTTEILSELHCPYAMLKGAYLCRYYPAGYRTSNDIDLLVLPEDLTEIGNAFYNAGFRQGNIRNGEFVPAARKEIIESRMMRGETVPYIKWVGLPQMEYLEVDLNFSLDYQSGDAEMIRILLNRATDRGVGDLTVRTLDPCDFFLHLCAHLYKEATTLPWVEMMRDMTLYKYCDIYTLLEEMKLEQVNALFSRAKELGIERICAFAILQTAELFCVNNGTATETAYLSISEDPDFLHRIVSPKDHKTWIYTEKSAIERLFSVNRKKMLKEEKSNGTT